MLLAIVSSPGDWERIERARHFAHDPAFNEWPPVIQLFHHPFDKSPYAPFDVAQVIEDLEVESFEVKMDSWVIISNLEATKKEWENQLILPDRRSREYKIKFVCIMNNSIKSQISKLKN